MNRTIRVFCTKLSGISLRKLLESLVESGHHTRIVDASLDFDIESPAWTSTQLICADASPPITLEHYIAGMHGMKVEDNIDMFLEALDFLDESWGKKEVAVYLKMTRELYVIIVRDDAGSTAFKTADQCAKIIEQLGEGMVQVDNEGFYKNDELILQLKN